MKASAEARFRSANRRAFSARLVPAETATCWAIWFHHHGALFGAATPCQNRAASIWSAVRVALLREPSSLTWFKASVYSALVSAGGGGGRNCEPLCSAKGVTKGQWGLAGGPKAGGVGCQSPGAVPGV